MVGNSAGQLGTEAVRGLHRRTGSCGGERNFDPVVGERLLGERRA